MMKNRFLILGICLIILSSTFTPLVNAYNIVIDEGGAGGAELGTGGLEYYSRTFYSNYSNRFYSLYSYEGIGYPAPEIHYSSSVDDISWTDNEQFLSSDSSLGGKTPAIYLHPDGQFIEYCFEQRTDDDALWWGRKEILLNGSIVNNITSVNIIDGLFGAGSHEVSDEYSIVVDSAGFVYIGFEAYKGDNTYLVIKSMFGNGTWNHEEFEHIWYIELEWIDNGGGNPSNTKWGGKLFPLNKTEDVGLVFFYTEQAGTQELHRSMYYDNSTDDWINLSGGLFNDNEGGDWADNCWTIGYSDDIVVFFKQNEGIFTPDRIRLDAKFLNIDTLTWENQTAISYEVLGDEGALEFMPLVSVNEENESINFIWSIVGNDTIWYRRMYPNHTLESIGILESDLDNVLIENQFNSHPRSFSPMGVSWLVNEGTIPESPFAGDFVLHNYLTFLEDNWSISYRHYNTTLYNEDGSVNDGWIFKGDIYTIVSYFMGADLYYLNFTDGQHDISIRFDNSTGLIYIVTGESFVLGEIYANYTLFSDGTQRIKCTFIPDINIVDIEDCAVDYYIYNEELDVSTMSSTGLYFNIYNLGGFTYYTFLGDGGRTIGGSPFEIYATNGTENSRARAEQIFRKLQHISFLMEIDMNNEWDSENGEFDIDAGVAWIDIGFDYRLNGSWIEGLFIRLFIQDADVGHHDLGIDHNWVEWEVELYNYVPSAGVVQNIASQLIYSNHWGYEHENYVPDYYNRTSCQLWVDLWFDKTNASTTIAAQVNAYYHGLKEQGASWWFGYGKFIPMVSNYDNAKYLDDLYDEGGNITNCQKFDLIKFFIEVVKVSSVDGDDETWTIRGIEDMHREQAIDRMEGIDEPTFVQTKVLDMPQTGFINAIKSAINGLSSAIWKGAFQFIKLMMGAVGNLMDAIGLGEWWRAFTTAMENIAAYSLNLMDNLQIALINSAILLEQLFEVISTTFTRFILGITSFLSGILTWYREIVNLFTGGGIWNINVWVTLELGDWVGLAINLLPVWWFIRIAESNDKIRTLQGDISFVIMITTGLFHFLSSIIILAATLINLLLGLLPI